MTEEKNKFVLYQYLYYFWKKKWYFLIVPVITTILVVASVFFLTKDEPYEGQALIFTGSINTQKLVHQNNILALFDEEFQNNIDDLFVSEKGQVKFKVSGDSEQEVQSYLDKIVDVYFKELEEEANSRINITKQSIGVYEERAEALEQSISLYNEKLESADIEMAEEYSELIMITEQELTNATVRIEKMSSDVKLYQQPSVLSTNITKAKTYIMEAVAIGIVLGLVVTVVLLMLLKYIGDAKRYFKQS